MVLYGLALTPLLEQLCLGVPSVVQPWYAHNMAMGGPVHSITTAMCLLERQGPASGWSRAFAWAMPVRLIQQSFS